MISQESRYVQAVCEFQVDGAETENAREEKLVVMLESLDRRFELKECKVLGGR